MKKVKNETYEAKEAALEARDDCGNFSIDAQEAKNKTIELHAEAGHFAKQAEIFRNDTEGFKGEANDFADQAFISESSCVKSQQKKFSLINYFSKVLCYEKNV